MKVTGIRTQLYEVDLNRILGDANSPRGRRRNAGLAVFVDTDTELVGVAIGTPGIDGALRGMFPLIEGQDPRSVRGLWKRMVDAAFKGGTVGVVNDAIAAIDVALWDLKAKANDEPLWMTLGALAPRCRAYASGLDMPLIDDELRTYYAGMAAKGVTAGKLKVGLDQEADLRRLGVMRDALRGRTPRPELMIDANEFWSPKQAIRKIRALEEHFDLTWVEEPARRWDYRGLRLVSESVRAAVATGENLDHIGEFMALLDQRAVDIVQVGSSTTGITGALTVAEMAYGFEVPVSVMNSPGSFMAHLAAALPNHTMLEVLAAGRDAVFSIDARLENGWIELGPKPGLGLVFDPEKLARYRVESVAREAVASPWGRRQGAALYDNPPSEAERG
ncbi:MAG: mandelate racemase/muconate lactonizing enzyme family protein [Actinobacteria bacterium]|nr:mandelate racemase/muconate lactonizing enzyme family protein [Actinomycetota bacterium]